MLTTSIFPVEATPQGGGRPVAVEAVAPPSDPRPAARPETARPVAPVRTVEQGSAARAALERSASDLSPEEQEVVEQLKARDREVRTHEQAHAAVGGEFAGSPTYTYQTGPDGNQYAIGGQVAIDVAPIPDDPEATIQKMDVVKRAALAPAAPSSQARRVAALADQQRQVALADLLALRAAARAIEQGAEAQTGPIGPVLMDRAA